MNKEKLLKRMALMVFFIFIVNFLAMKFYWYSSLWWFDMPMHFLGGFFLGMIGLYLLLPKDFSSAYVFKLFLFVLVVGAGWEVFEIIVNQISSNPFYILDTISDIFFDVSGGLSAILYLCRKN
ncbi:MAG: hypothetical protein V4504_02435 [Patescibacteria group bacterium]